MGINLNTSNKAETNTTPTQTTLMKNIRLDKTSVLHNFTGHFFFRKQIKTESIKLKTNYLFNDDRY